MPIQLVTNQQLATLTEIAVQLTKSMATEDRFHSLLNEINRSFPSDASCLLSINGDLLTVLAERGISKNVISKQFKIKDHPRFQIIASSKIPTKFPYDSCIADPFDGLLDDDSFALKTIHSCIGCPLYVDENLVGMFTMDSRAPFQFDNIDDQLLQLVAALAGATLQTALILGDKLASKASETTSTLAKPLNNFGHRELPVLLGRSDPMKAVQHHIKVIANCDLPVLIQGDTGTGKEVVARHIHAQSLRSKAPMCYVNCAALPESIIESELFGHIKGAFTGAHSDRMGKFQLAHRGTLFLDEVGELPLHVQPVLLRALQDGEVQKIGSDRSIQTDVRIITATNKRLEDEVSAGRFRADLFHRLNAYTINLPRLRDRQSDIIEITNHFASEVQQKYHTKPIVFEDNAYEALCHYVWPGNVREAKNLIARMILKLHTDRPRAGVLLVTENDVQADLNLKKAIPNVTESLAGKIDDSYFAGRHLKEATMKFQQAYIVSHFHNNEKNWAKTAKAIGLDRSNLYNLAKRLGIVDGG